MLCCDCVVAMLCSYSCTKSVSTGSATRGERLWCGWCGSQERISMSAVPTNFPDGSAGKESTAMQETPVRFLSQEDLLE